MNEQLSKTPWLAGENYSIADISLVVYLTRMTSFQMAPLWKDFTYLQNWFEKIKARDAYKRAVDDWGDVTEQRRRENGIEAYPILEQYWHGK